MFVGITGAQGSGKTTISKHLVKKLNGTHVEGDKVAHELLTEEKFYALFVEKFGRGILDKDQKIVRKKLGEKAFETNEGYEFLNEVCEKALEEKFRKMIAENQVTVIEYSPLPLFKNLWKDCDVKVMISAGKTERKRRILLRDNISPDYFENRDKMAKKLKKFDFDITVKNESPHDIEKCVNQIEMIITNKTHKI